MKKLYFLLLLFCFFNLGNAQIINIPDINFKMKLIALNVDTNSNFQIEVSEALSLNFLDLSNSNISSFEGLENFVNLEYLNCSNNPVNRDIDFNVLKKLVYLNYSSIQSKRYLKITDLPNLATLRIEGLTNLEFLECTGNPKLATLSVNGAVNLTEMWASNNALTSLEIEGLTSLKKMYCQVNKLATLNIDALTNLEDLECGGNLLTSLNLTQLTNLKGLACSNNKLFKLDASNLSNLTTLDCSFNEIFELKLNGINNLKNLNCQSNQLSTLSLNNLINLESLWCGVNQLQQLDLNALTKLVDLRCAANQFSSLDLKGLTNITIFECYLNQLKTLELSDLKKIKRLRCDQNQLNTLFIKNGSNETELNFSKNPDLKYICVDEGQLSQIQDLLDNYGYANCNVNTYCSFNPVGEYYTIQGDNRVDEDNNGCDTQDLSLPNLKFNLSDGTSSSGFIANGNNYSISLPTGSHSITPVLENPTYFSISPSVVNVDFPSQISPLNQNFCITPNGTHSDLEVVILQINAARPGFNATYKVIYKNKGNTIQSGTVNLTFDDSVLDVISVNPSASSQTTNVLLWDFLNLKPFESKEITLTVKISSPTESPAVNNGDILKFTATVLLQGNDETPIDNVFTLNQTVVGSYDPNDKTCLEGSVITSKLIGEYVHYMIRFENTGTYAAQNIVVKDMIDPNKFDISTLIPTSSSHSFITKISEENKVEFIFEGINLPFDDENNDGYIAFKIKTKPTLKVGDSFTNDANIYFDYNFPILTNKAISTFNSTLSSEDFNFSRYVSLYPNPASQFLNISQHQNIEIQSFEIYDILGQLVIAIPNAKTTSNIDISKLKTGNYFIKVKSDKGNSSSKFIKI
ncbi:T9SS type A sorting domain-containing protein [Flavobacterium sp. IB48]|nr:T9SS type A sorting domain-containing protein [Flavobacterium sp. IB48]